MAVQRFFVALVLFVTLVMAASAQKVTFTTIESEPFWGSQLANDGFLAAVSREAFKRAGYTQQLRYLAFSQALVEATGGLDCLGIFGFYHTPQREATFLFSEPLFSVEVVFVGLKSKRLKYSNLNDLNGLTVGIISGADYGPEFAAATGFRKYQSRDKPSNMKNLLAGQVDLILEIREVALGLAEDEKALDKVELVGAPLQVKPLYIGFTKALSKSPQLKADFDKAFLTVQKDGTYEKLRAQYGLRK